MIYIVLNDRYGLTSTVLYIYFAVRWMRAQLKVVVLMRGVTRVQQRQTREGPILGGPAISNA
jgi:hypothetical protein